MKSADQEFAAEEDLLELSKQGYFTIMLDKNLRVLQSSLEDDGFKVVMPQRFKVVMPQQGRTDDALKRQARGWAILTKNSQDFIDEAVRYDYDVIGIEGIKFVDDQPGRNNETVHKISNAVRRSQLATRKGNFWLKIRDNGSFHLEQLV